MNPIHLSCHEETRSLVRAIGLSVVLLLHSNLNLIAQDGPPLPPILPPTQPPREPTPEELEAQRKAQEAVWQANRERMTPYLHSVPAAEPEDLILKQRLISAELQEREWKREAERQRDVKLRDWAAETRVQQREALEQAKKLARELGIPIADDVPGGHHVDYRDGRLVLVAPMNVNAQKTIGVWKAKTNAPAEYPLNQLGEYLGMWEISVPGTNHAELNNGGVPRLIYLDTGSNLDYRAHATAMAGTIAAAGVQADAEGMVSSATILAKDNDGDVDEMADMALDFGVRVSNHSYGTPMGWVGDIWVGGGTNDYYDRNFGFYGSKAALLDSLAYLQQEYLSVWPTGNDRDNTSYSGQAHFHLGSTNLFTCQHAADQHWLNGYKTLTPESTAKNVLSVGSIHDLTNGWQSAGGVTLSGFSNFGPTLDGRLKPEIVSNGQGVYSSSTDGSGNDTYTTASGTSSAAAGMTGMLSLLRERLYQVGVPQPSAALQKAIVTLNADEVSRPGPDYDGGYGNANADRSVGFVLTNKYYGNPAGGLVKGNYLEAVLTNGTTHAYAVHKGPSSILRVKLDWSDPAGQFSLLMSNGVPVLSTTNRMLVNDLDVRIIHGGNTNTAWVLDPTSPTSNAVRGDNVRDNHELVEWPNDSSSGVFTIQVSHKGTLKDAAYLGNTTNQPYALAVAGHVLERRPEIVDIAQTASNKVTVAWTGVLYSFYKVQYIDTVDALASAWTDATGQVQITNTTAAVELTMSTNTTHRFYRVIRP